MERVPILMKDKKYDEISEKISKEFPNSCILFIDEIINPSLKILYEEYKSTLDVNKYEELELFHGTHARLIDKIAFEGFDPTKNVISAYGKGTYFSKLASYSYSYMKSKDKQGISYMFIAKVISQKKSLTHIYVIPEYQATYPKYIIAFHKNAK